MTLNIVVLRTDEGTVGEFLWDILLCRKDKGNHRERFTLEKLLIFSTFLLHCSTYQTHAIGYQGTSAKRRRCPNVLRTLGGDYIGW